MKTSIVGTVAIIAIVLAAFVTYLVYDDNGGREATDTDYIVRDYVIVGDYIDLDVDMEVSASADYTGEDKDSVLYTLYNCYGDYVGTQDYVYKGTTIVCDKYEYVYENVRMIYLIDPGSGVVYYSESDYGGLFNTTALTDSNLDLTKTFDDQEISVGSFTEYDGSSTVRLYGMAFFMEGTSKLTVTNAVAGGEEVYYDVSSEYELKGAAQLVMEVEAVNSDGTLKIKGNEEPVSQEQFFSLISYTKFVNSLEEQGAVLTDVKNTVIKRDTVFGLREMTVQSAKLLLDEQVIQAGFAFGNADVLYGVHLFEQTDRGYTVEDLDLNGSSLISVKN